MSHGAGVVAIHDSKVLLVQLNYGPFSGQWILPGGLLEPKEHPHEAALRELKEETGLTAKIKKLLAVRHRLFEDGGDNTFWIFSAEVELWDVSTPLQFPQEELQDARFWAVEEALLSDTVRPQTRHYIRLALGKTRFDSMQELEGSHDDWVYHSA